ncbi:MAG: hypothetical protein V4550_18455 [Gemmatimonadota bacterium]
MSDFEDDDFDDSSPFDDIAQELDDGRSFVKEDEALQPEILDPIKPSGYIDPLQDDIERFATAEKNAAVKDEFYQHVEAEIERIRRINAASASIGNPPSATGKSPALGSNASLTSDIVIVQDSVARWQGEDHETGPVTVTIGLVTPLVSTAGAVVRPFAIVHWGSYGNNFTAEIDIGTGRQFTINASMIEVLVALDALTASNTAQANMCANLSFRDMVRTSPLIRTRYIDSQAQNVPASIVVPPFASGILPVQMSDPGGSVQIDFIDTSNTIRYTLNIGNGTQISTIPLTSDIVKLNVTTTTMTTQHVRLPFELSI